MAQQQGKRCRPAAAHRRSNRCGGYDRPGRQQALQRFHITFCSRCVKAGCQLGRQVRNEQVQLAAKGTAAPRPAACCQLLHTLQHVTPAAAAAGSMEADSDSDLCEILVL